MPLRLFNTLTKSEEDFFPLEKGKVRLYTCGPTVYGRPHIGNYASFLMADLLRRWLEVSGYEVLHVKNITDVGHLVADADQGEDKVEAQAKKEQRDPLEIAQKYEKEFLEDERDLRILEPLARPRATETIQEMLSIIRTLLKSGNAYETEDGIYFSVLSFPPYGKLSGNTLENLDKLSEGVRVRLKDSKKHPADFALWKKCIGENSKHVLRWNFQTGERLSGAGDDPKAGFPGWHIECSAMSTKFLGEQLDIHTGGEDNIFPHHDCEIAQSECAFRKPFVRYWMHRRRVNFVDPATPLRSSGASEGQASSGQAQKMSKSLGNILTLPDIVARGFHPLDLRYFLLSSHYRSHTTFSWKGLEDAKKARLKVMEWMEEIRREETKETKESNESKELRMFRERFTEAMNADLNTPAALAAVFDAIAWTYRLEEHGGAFADDVVRDLWKFIKMIRDTFGCFEEEEVEIPPEVTKLVSDREEARRGGEYERSDTLRKEALKLGYVLEDLKDGTKIVPRERRG